jgi:hypothetical protein
MICLLGRNRDYLHIEKPKQEYIFLSKTNSFLQGKYVLDYPAPNADDLLSKCSLFHQSAQ